MPSFDDMTTDDLRAACEEMRTEIDRRDAEAEARASVVAAVEGYAALRGVSVLEAWRALAPEGVQVPDDPEPAPVPDAPAYVRPTGAHDSYKVGDRVTFQGRVYEAAINAIVWSPLAYPQAWKEVR
ncbi:carbohydrate-binding protein [Brachybacterium sp. GPGPB12]|uniref:carbohydrate-binding protein n=1 Tax=Brachybacterium sp. GPGPB12 TaxID=3023517 RepID=UPI0031346116